MSGPPRILTIAGSDSGGGAGIQGDLKTIAAHGCYGLSVITALTAQNTMGVEGIHAPPAKFVALQYTAVSSDISVHAAKTGMLFSADIIELLADLLADRSFPLVVDPVSVSQSGHKLLEDEAVDALKKRMLPLADILTPNRPETEALTGMRIEAESDVLEAGAKLLDMGCKAVLIKGGHLIDPSSEVLSDWLFTSGAAPEALTHPRIETEHTHGTGCALSAAIACNLGRGFELFEAVARAQTYLGAALRFAFAVGRGAGPPHHLHPFVGTDLDPQNCEEEE